VVIESHMLVRGEVVGIIEIELNLACQDGLSEVSDTIIKDSGKDSCRNGII
jgi:hypothetical protein